MKVGECGQQTIARQEENSRFVKLESKFNLDYTANGILDETAVSELLQNVAVCCSLASHLEASG